MSIRLVDNTAAPRLVAGVNSTVLRQKALTEICGVGSRCQKPCLEDLARRKPAARQHASTLSSFRHGCAVRTCAIWQQHICTAEGGAHVRSNERHLKKLFADMRDAAVTPKGRRIEVHAR